MIPCRRVVTLLGSRDGCKVTLRHKSVAPVHLALVNDGAKVRAVDLITPSGSLLNGLKLESEVLSDGDVLKLYPWEFRVELTLPPGHEEGDPAPVDLEPTPSAVGLEHLATNRLLQPARETCIIGRRQGCDIAISDPRVSRVHALLLTGFGHPLIVDLLSKVTTRVNGEPIVSRVLQDEDLLTIGDSRFRVRVVGSAVGRAPGEGSRDNWAGADGSGSGTLPLPLEDHIDIQGVEGSQRWRIAENLERAGGNP